MKLFIFWFFILILIYFFINCKNTYESFNELNYNNIKNYIVINYNPITYIDKNSLNSFKTYVSSILTNYNIERKLYFLKMYDLNKRYNLEVIIIIGDILKKLIEIELLIVNNKIEIQDINIKDNDDILLQGYNSHEDNNFLMPQDFSWKENPVYQNIVFPDDNKQSTRVTADNLQQLSRRIKLNNQLDIKKALNMAKSTLKNRDSFYEQGFCFGTKLIGIDNQRDCELNFGTWDKACTKNEDCKFYKEQSNGRGGRGGCIESGYCEFPRGVERIGYTKGKKREQDRINRLKLGSNYQFSNQIEFDIPSCYCEDPTQISPDCCYNRDYVF